MASPNDKGPFETVDSKADSLAERFEQAWASQNDTSKGVDLSAFLPAPNDPARNAALVELVKTDLSCRWQRGLPTSLELYVEKFPEIGPLEKLPPSLVYEEFRIRARHGSPAPLAQYKSRFPKQFAALEKLIQTEQSQANQLTTASNPDLALESQRNLTAALPNSPLAPLGAGTLVGGHYTLTKRIGTGGFGEVWLGNDVHGNIPKAIKIIFRSVESDEAKTELHALEIIKRLNHPYLLRTEGFFAEQDRLIVVMELAADGSLRELLKKSKKENDSGLPVEKLLVYMRHAAEALDYLAEEGIFHRDIKPENILLVGKTAKVADFGLAKLAANRQSTKTNFAGTSAYSSPETWRGRVTAKSDLYSLAATYGELRLGRPVFKGSTIYEFMIEHLQSQPNLEPMPEPEKAVLLRALAKNPDDRYPTCGEFVRDLERAVAGPGSIRAAGPLAPGSSTPVSRWSTKPESIALNTQRPGNSSGGRPPSWNSLPSRSDADLEIEPPSYRRRRRRSKNPIVMTFVGVVLIATIAAVASFLAHNRLESKSQELAAKRDFSGALKTIDDGSFLAAPFKSSLKDDVFKTGLAMAEKAKASDNLDDVVKTTVALMDAFPTDDKAPAAILNETVQKHVPEMMGRGKFAEAYALLFSLPSGVAARRDLLPAVGRKWLDRAWEDVDNKNYAEAKQIASDLLAIDPNQADAVALDNLVGAAQNVHGMILKGKYREVMQKIPRSPSGKGKALAEQLRGDVKTAWLKHAEDLNAKGKYDAAQQSLFQFSEFFKNDSAGNALYKTTLAKLFKDVLYPQGQYEEALALLGKTNFEFTGLVDDVKTKWREAELAKFAKGDEAAKERALQGLVKLAEQFGSDDSLRDDCRKCRTALYDALYPEIEETLKTRNFSRALNLIAKAERYAQDPGQEIRLKSLQLLALVESPPADRKAVKELLKQVMKQPDKVHNPEQILNGVLKIGKDDPAFFKDTLKELIAFRDVIAEDKLPAGFWEVPGMAPSGAPNATGSAKIMADASKAYVAGDYDQSLKTLAQLDVRREADKGIKQKYYVLFAKLGEKVALSRAEVAGLESVVAEYPEVKPYVSKAMARVIGQAWKTWPSAGETWASRLKDAEGAEPDPVVLAFKAEGLLETGKAVDFELTPGQGDVKAYVDYVRAIVAASKKKRDDLSAAARTLEKLSSKDPWLAPPRREKASQTLQAAAVELTRTNDGSPRIFESAQEATQAYAWIDKSLKLVDKSLKDATKLPPETELTLALAAACKSPPALELNKTLGDDLLANPSAKLTDFDRVNLALSNPVAFAAALKKLKSESLVRANEIGAMLAVGESQLESADDPELAQRQGQLFVLKGWALEQEPQKDDEAIYAAYSSAAKLDPTNGAVLVAKGRYGAVIALAAAAKVTNSESKIRLWQQGVKACDAALKKNLVGDDGWADLCLQRSQLALELGNEYYRINQLDGQKEAFLDARAYAQKALDALKTVDAKSSQKKLANAWLALGNAYEDLAHFAKIDIPENYAAASKALDEATRLEPDYVFNAGRCRYRWARDDDAKLDEATKKQYFNIALLKLGPIASNKKNPHAAQASYWEGFTNWNLRYPVKAFESFERAVRLGQKSDQSAIWARHSFDAIALLTRDQLAADPKRSLEWVEAAEASARPLKYSPTFKGAGQVLNDLTAEVYLELAKKELAAKEFANYKAHVSKAVELNHSTKAHEIAVERAFLSKKNRSVLNLNLTEIYDQTIAAINGMTNLTDSQKQKERSDFETFWKKIP